MPIITDISWHELYSVDFWIQLEALCISETKAQPSIFIWWVETRTLECDWAGILFKRWNTFVARNVFFASKEKLIRGWLWPGPRPWGEGAASVCVALGYMIPWGVGHMIAQHQINKVSCAGVKICFCLKM